MGLERDFPGLWFETWPNIHALAHAAWIIANAKDLGGRAACEVRTRRCVVVDEFGVIIWREGE